MQQNNIFEGGSTKAKLARIVYHQLLTGEWVKAISFLEAYYKSINKKDDEPQKLAAYEGYNDLRKALMKVRQAMENKYPGCIIEKGNNRNKEYQYTGTDKAPLDDLLNAATVRDIRTYFDFCQHSAGLMPAEWIEHFFRNTKDLLEINKKRKTQQQIIFTDNRRLRNIGLLPVIYEYISQSKPFRFTYKSFGNEAQPLVIHPHYLREFNGRWFLLGQVAGECSPSISVIALDRIEGEIEKVEGVPYIQPGKELYQERFENMVGVSAYKNDLTVHHVHIRVYGQYMWGLIITKPLHSTQTIAQEYDEQVEYGDIELQVVINQELIGRILHYGESLEVLSPQQLRETISNKVKKMYNLYSKM